jgi:hypothetical protein
MSGRRCFQTDELNEIKHMTYSQRVAESYKLKLELAGCLTCAELAHKTSRKKLIDSFLMIQEDTIQTISVNDTVINPIKNDPTHFMADLMEVEPITKKVRAIFERDMTTEESGYTKQVQRSNDSTAYVFLDGSDKKYRLGDMVKK